MKTKILITALAAFVAVGSVAAQNQEPVKQDNKTTQQGPLYVDKNKNGVCDNYESGNPRNPNANGKERLLDGSGAGRGKAIGARKGGGKGRGKAIGPRDGRGRGRAIGPRDGRGRENGRRLGFGPRDGRGRRVEGRGPGRGTGLRNGRGTAVNFVDVDKNGICDRREDGTIVEK